MVIHQAPFSRPLKQRCGERAPWLSLLHVTRLILTKVFWSFDRELGIRLGPRVKLCTDIMEFLAFVSMRVYVVARMVLCVVALVALRDLSPGAFEVVRWMSFLPHI